MKHGLYICSLALLSCATLLPSCKQQNELEEVVLTVSAGELSFAKDAGEQTISVTTTASEWTYFSAQELSWFTLHQEGNNLRVVVTANPTGADRTALILISSAGQMKRITLRQSAADAVITADMTQVEFDTQGGVRTISFRSNTEGVKAELADPVDWLSIRSVEHGLLTLEAQPSTEKSSRNAKVLLSIGGATQEIQVTQRGTINYIMPLVQFPLPLIDLVKFEKARGSELIKTPDGMDTDETYRFLLDNKLTPTLEYSYHKSNGRGYFSALWMSDQPEYFRDNADFTAFLDGYGFKKVKEEQLKPEGVLVTYAKDNSPYSLEVTFPRAGVMLELKYTGLQDQAYATFTRLPMQEQAEKMGHWMLKIDGASRENVRTFESGHKSVLDESIGVATYDRFNVGDSFDTESVRGYFYLAAGGRVKKTDPQIDHVQGVQALYPNFNLGYYIDPFDDAHLTKEFKEFLASQGYVYIRRIPEGYDLFYNQTTRKAYLTQVIRDRSQRMMEMQMAYIQMQTSGLSYELFSDYSRYLKYRKQQHEAILQAFPLLRHRAPRR